MLRPFKCFNFRVRGESNAHESAQVTSWVWGEKIFVRFLFRWVLLLEMNMIEDAELLRRYAIAHTEDAFAELVRRHLNLVYSAALRQVSGDHQWPEEVTQKRFYRFGAQGGFAFRACGAFSIRSNLIIESAQTIH